MEAGGCPTLMDVLRLRADAAPDRVAYRFLPGDGAAELSVSYAQLERRARAIAAHLASFARPGDRVVLFYQPGLDYIAAYFGCIFAGVVAVPAYPPHPRRADPRVHRIVADAGATVALTTRAVLDRLEATRDGDATLAALRWVATDEVRSDDASAWRAPAIGATTLAMLQYTSGSTAAPRGVMLTHANLLHNLALVRRLFAHTSRDVGVIWLPPFHDMGLIGGILEPCFVGFPVVLMPPASFLRRPASWLEAISHYGATGSGAPNFAYDLCVERVTDAERAHLDLSRWRTAFNGAEPVRAETLERFARAFAGVGFRRESFLPCYGLAEATLIVSGGPAGAGARTITASRSALEAHRVAAPERASDELSLVGAGRVAPGIEIAIVHPETGERCADDAVGEIWVRGESVGSGYWGSDEATAEVFGAALAGGADARFLRTGDLGFVHDGELVVAGRCKDLIILDGRNVYPQDVELVAARSHPSLRPGYAAAFGVSAGGRERLVVALEVGRRHRAEDDAAVFSAVRQRLVDELGVLPHGVVLVRQNGIPRTSSGKVQRRATHDAWCAGELPVVGELALPVRDAVDVPDATSNGAPAGGAAPLAEGASPLAPAAVGDWLAQWVADELQLDADAIDRSASLQDYGLDSLAALRLVVAAERELGVRLELDGLWRQPTLTAVASYLASGGRRVPAPASGAWEDADDPARFPEVRALHDRLAALAAAGIQNPFFAVHERTTGSLATIHGRELLNFANYNYLDLSGHPAVNAAAQGAIARYGTSVSASRIVSGERPLHRELERAIAAFLGAEDAVVFIGGHTTNVSTISHLVGAEDLVVCDELSHNSIMQGAQLSSARRLVFPHNDWRALDSMLTDLRGGYRRVLIAIEGVYSADGDIAALPAFVEVKRRHRALLLVDEAHSLGTLGATGRGIAEHAGVSVDAVDLWMGTLSKSLASCGGYIAGRQSVVEYLRYTAPGFVFSVGMTPSNAAAALAALRVLETEPERVTKLQGNAALFLQLARARGLDTGLSAGSPVVPVIVGESLRAMRLSQRLRELGVNVQPMVAPAVDEGRARLRFFLSSAHTPVQLRTAVELVAQALASLEATTNGKKARAHGPGASAGELALAGDASTDD